MNSKTLLLLTGGLLLAGLSSAFSQNTAFTYQGRLTDGGMPANGRYDAQFSLLDAATNGNAVAPPVTVDDVDVADGLFTVTLDFGAPAFDGQPRWLEIRVRPGDRTDSFTTLSPRQRLTPAPYALHARIAGEIAEGKVVRSLNALKDDVTLEAGPNVVLTAEGNTIKISAAAMRGLPGPQGPQGPPGPSDAWLLHGNAGTTPGSDFLGTTDFKALEMKVANNRVLRLEPTVSTPNLIGGATNNAVASGVTGATISGGARNSIQARADGATIGGGTNNVVQMNASCATIPGGRDNLAAGTNSFAAGYRAKANHSGAHVWADSNGFDFGSETANQFRIRATGGTEFVTAINSSGLPTASVKVNWTNGVSIASLRDTDSALELRRGGIKVTGAGLATPTPVFIHRATTNSFISTGIVYDNATVIDHPLCNGDPNAILMVTPNLNPSDATGVNGVPILKAVGVWYTGNDPVVPARLRQKWAIYYLEGTRMEVRTAFNVLVVKP